MRPVSRLSPVALTVCVAALLHVGAGLAASSTLYVKTSGSDSSTNCSLTTPCRTIKHAVAVAASGDTIQVGVGTFSEDFGIDIIHKKLTIIGSSWLGTRVTLGWYGPGGKPVFTIFGDATVTLIGMTISGGLGQFAGGISNAGALTLQNVVIWGNRATDSAGGAGILNTSSLLMTNVAVTHNQGRFGVLNGGDAYISDSRITDTYGGLGGTGVGNTGAAVLTIDRALIAGNQGAGLAIWNPVPGAEASCPDTTLMNVTISGNADGGVDATSGKNCESHQLMLTHVTIAANKNKSSIGSGGLRVDSFSPALMNSIVATNGGAQCSFEGPIASIAVTNSLIGDNSCFASPLGNLIGVDPMLGPLKYGVNDPIAKVLLLGATRVHALKSGSPAIDSGADDYCAAIDQFGVLRPIDGDGDGVAHCDMGAYEYRPPQRAER